jgi:hypothetical protein
VSIGTYTSLALVTVPGTFTTATPVPTATWTPLPATTPTGGPTPACTPGIGPWSFVAPYPVSLQSPAVATDGTYVYAAGGYADGTAFNLFNRYDPVANTWTALPPLPSALYDARAAYVPSTNSLYVVGGVIDGWPSTSLYIYNLGTNSWSSGAPLPAPRAWAAVAYYAPAGKIYVIGGRDAAGTDYQQTWAYDPLTNTWDTAHTADPVAQTGAVATVVGPYLYLMGPNTVHYRYDVAQDTWASMAPLPVIHTVAAGGAIGAQIAIFGGGLLGDPTTSVFDTSTNSWIGGPALNIGRSLTGGTAIGGRLIIIGGYLPSPNTNTNTVEMTAPLPCSTPTATPTATPTDTPTDTPTSTATATDTSTDTPTSTATATDTPTDTPTSTATVTPTATPCSTCSLAVTQVTLSCNPDGSVHWTAQVVNNGACAVTSYWGVVLAAQRANGTWQDAMQTGGRTTFPPRLTTVGGDFAYSPPPSVHALRAAFGITGAPPWCPAGGVSAPIARCPAH